MAAAGRVITTYPPGAIFRSRNFTTPRSAHWGSPDPKVEVRPRSPDDAFTILLDPSRTNSDFEWQADTMLGTGVAAAVDYYRQFGVTQTYTHLREMSKSE